MTTSLWERTSFAVIHAVASGMLATVGLSGLYRFGRLFGTLEWLVHYKRRRRFATALKRVLGDEPTPLQRRRTTREFFMRTRCDKIFYLIFDRIPRDRAGMLLTIDDQSALDAAIARGRGVCLAMSHHADHHVVAMLLPVRGYKLAGVRDRHEGALRRYIQERFDRRYPEFPRVRVLFSDGYPRDIYRCLREGYLLINAMDVSRVRDASQKTEEVTIFGERRRFPSGPLRIAIRCRSPVLQAFLTQAPDFRYRLEIVETLVDPNQGSDENTVVADAMRTYAANVERYVRASPSQISRV